MGRRKLWVFGIVIALIVIFLTPLASSHPDGLNRVAEDHGFIAAEKEPYFKTWFAGYGLDTTSDYWDGVISGTFGVILVGLVLYLLTRLMNYAKK